jgi:hypothetical protein
VLLDTSKEWCPQLQRGQLKKVCLADTRTSNGLPSASIPETEADRTPRESLFGEHDRHSLSGLLKALKLTGRRRFCLAGRRFFAVANFGNATQYFNGEYEIGRLKPLPAAVVPRRTQRCDSTLLPRPPKLR